MRVLVLGFDLFCLVGFLCGGFVWGFFPSNFNVGLMLNLPLQHDNPMGFNLHQRRLNFIFVIYVCFCISAKCGQLAGHCSLM